MKVYRIIQTKIIYYEENNIFKDTLTFNKDDKVHHFLYVLPAFSITLSYSSYFFWV